MLRGWCEGLGYCVRQLNSHEIVRRIQVVFSRVINDSEVPFLSGGLVRQDLINLAHIQIVAALVPHTQDKCWWGFSSCHRFLTQEAFNFEAFLPDTMRFVPVNLGSSDSAMKLPNAYPIRCGAADVKPFSIPLHSNRGLSTTVGGL